MTQRWRVIPAPESLRCKVAFKLFDLNKPGKGVSKADQKKKGLRGFFILTKDFFWKLAVVNIFYVFFNFPVFFGLYALSGNLDIPFSTPGTVGYQALYGVMRGGASPSAFSLWSVGARLAEAGYASSWTKIFFVLALLTLFTFGLSNAGMACVTRNIVRSTPLDLASDFFGTMKKNFKQAIPMGIIDFVALFALSFDVFYFYQSSLAGADFVTLLLMFISLFIFVTFVMMRFYIYIIMITFDLKLTKILKNSLIFAYAGLKRNAPALIGIIALAVVNYLLFIFITPIGAVLPFVITFALGALMASYAAYPKIKELMIDPYYETGDDKPESGEAIFTDDVSGK